MLLRLDGIRTSWRSLSRSVRGREGWYAHGRVSSVSWEAVKGWRSRALKRESLPQCICISTFPNLSFRLCTTGIPTVHTTPQSFSSTKEGLRLDVGACASMPCFPHFILVSLFLLKVSSRGLWSSRILDFIFIFCFLKYQILGFPGWHRQLGIWLLVWHRS